jgi:hypothetical protein
MHEVTIVPLQYWPDPQGDVLLSYSGEECLLHYACWLAPGDPADFICRLSFQKAAVVRAFRREYVPYPIPENARRGYMLQILNSEFTKEHSAYRQRFYSHIPADTTLRNHYVFCGHDIYYEIFAAGFTETVISQSAITDEKFLALIRSA